METHFDLEDRFHLFMPTDKMLVDEQWTLLPGISCVCVEKGCHPSLDSFENTLL